jgi:hypothetical protein
MRLWRRPRTTSPSCEIHVPISPTPGFLSQVRLLAASVRRNGGALADARIVVTVSRDEEPFDIAAANPWAARHPIEWRWVDRELWDASGIFGTAAQRFTYDFDAPFVVLLDADTLCTGPLDELPGLGPQALAGLVAHISPSPSEIPRAEDFWRELFVHAGLPEPRLDCEHSGWDFMEDDPARRRCPPYFNLGVLAGSRDVMRRLGEHVLDDMRRVDERLDTVFRCQLAVALALARTGTLAHALAPRWNFPNDERFARAYPHEVTDVRILHYLRSGEIERWSLATTADELERFLARTDLSPTNALLQARVRELAQELLPDLPTYA